MGLFSGCLLACDIDGTLMDNGRIAPRNIEAVKRFMDEGGHFSLATGRSVGAVSLVLHRLGRVSPSVLANGCMIYDFEQNAVLEQTFLKQEEHRMVQKMLETDLDVGIEVHSGDRAFTIVANEESRDHQAYEQLESEEMSFEDADRLAWNKTLFLFKNEEDREKGKQVIAAARPNSAFSDTTAVIDGRQRFYYEQFPAGVSKAFAVRRLRDLLSIQKGGLFAMGDYYNDVEMLQNADIAAVPAGAPDDVKKTAAFVAGSCLDGAVADFIEYLITMRKE